MIVAVASGKGGTGKTTLAVNLAKAAGMPVRLLDCDVEEPNAHLFAGGKRKERRIVSIPIPEVDETLCDGCGECGKFCEYNAIVALKIRAMVFPELCHGCGGCIRVCPKNAIREVDHRIGVVETFDSNGMALVHGRLDVGAPMAGPLIRAVKACKGDEPVTIVDAPPGTSCPVIAAVREADLTVLVTEPTPFGLHDLKLAVAMMRELKLPFGVVVNRMGIGDDRVHAFCEKEHIPVLAEIPDDRRIAEVYSRGGLIVDELPDVRKSFETLFKKLWDLFHGEGE